MVQTQNQLHIYFCFVLWLNIYGMLCLVSLVSVGWALELGLGLLTSFAGFGWRKRSQIFVAIAAYTIVWCIWLACNSRIFNDKYSENQVFWDTIRHMTFIWCKAHDLFRGIFPHRYVERLESFSLLMGFFFPFFC